jgi:hypothetical protein
MTKLGFLLSCLLAVSVMLGGCAGGEGTPSPGVTAMPSPTTGPAESPVELLLEIQEPEDESIVSTASVVVRGVTVPDAIVSLMFDSEIEIAEVDEAGNFAETVDLQEGPNVIEVLSSDWEGHEASVIVTVIYLP